MLAAAALAAACAAWHPQAVGHYVGLVESVGEKPIDTWITLAPDGRLEGRYVMHEPGRDVDGTLEPVGDDGLRGGIVPLDRPLRHWGRPVAVPPGPPLLRGLVGEGRRQPGVGMAELHA